MSLYSDLNEVLTAYAQKIKDKADKSTTYTKTEVDNLISEVEVETDTTLDVPGAPADSAETGRQIGLLKADLGDKLDAYLNVDFSIDNKRVNSIGSIAVSNGQRITDYYPCSEGTVVKWHGKSFIYGGASVMCLIAFFDADKAFITGITSVSGETTSVIGDVSAIAPAGTAYVVGSTTSVANYYLHVYDVNIDNIRAKIDGLPWDLSMIAPVETAYTATRNYTVGQLLIVDNTLYKVTSNIANGGTITAGTNVVATTLSEVIASLS